MLVGVGAYAMRGLRGRAGAPFYCDENRVNWGRTRRVSLDSDKTPADEIPAAKREPVPELDPEAREAAGRESQFDEPDTASEFETGGDESFVSPETRPVPQVFDHTDRPPAEDEDVVTDFPEVESDRHEETETRTERPRPPSATELEPEREDFTKTDEPVESANASIYPGQMQAVRAPGWDQSAHVSRADMEKRAGGAKRHSPESAPELSPASSPMLEAFEDERKHDDPNAPAMAPLDHDHTETPPPPTSRQNRKFTAVDAAAKELARAALQAEIEREEKQAMTRYEPEEGEVPPSPEVAKRFDVILQLGKGGMAVVYLCRDPRRNGKILAVKDIRAELKPGMKVEQRVEHEAMLLKDLDHKGIVKVYDFLKFHRGSAIVMEYIDGLPLDHEIGAGRRIAWDFAARVMKEIGEALQYAHEHGVIHRDIKPDNILWSERHNVMKLVDFGLARLFGETPDVQMTRTGMVVGTPHYMSPEQVSGKPLDPRSDVYSLGATIYYLLTGQRHVEGTNIMDILEQQRSKDIKPPSHVQRDVPAFLSYIIGRMMEIKPEDRYQNMQEMVDDLERAMEAPDHFLEGKRPVKRYAGAELAPFAGNEFFDDLPSDLQPGASDRVTARVAGRRRTTKRRSDSSLEAVAEQMLEEDVTPAQISGMLKEISARLEKAEKRMVGPGLLVLIVLLCVLIVVLAIVGGLMFAAREGYVDRILGL